MANTDSRKLQVDVVARISQLEKQMAKAAKVTDTNMRKVESRAAAMVSKVNSNFANFGKGLAGGFAAALAPMALFQTALQTINDASHLVDTADKIGITTTALQELGFGFSQAGVEAAEFETGMEQFTKRIGEAATNGGRLADILAANGVALRDSNGEIRSSESLLADYANLMKNAATEQERMVLATEAFGRGGAGFTVALKDGAAGLDNMRKAAEEAGGVIDEELLRRAEEMGDRWEAGWRRFKVASQSAILTAIEGLDDLNNQMKKFLENRNAVEGGEWVGSLAGTVPSGKGDRLTGVDARIDAAFLGEIVKADAALVEQLKKRYSEAAGKATIIPPSGGGVGGGGGPKSDKFSPDHGAFAEMIGATEEWRKQQELSNRTMEEFGNIAQSAGASLATAFADGKLEGKELLSIIGQVASQLLQMGNIGGGGIGGNFFTSLLGGVLGGFDQGGYTGNGGRLQPAGIVHKGEVVFSQNDVRRHGGVGAVEAMRLGMPGFAAGGIVAMPSISAPRAPAAQPAQVHVTVGVSADNNGNLLPFVDQVSSRNAVAVVQHARPDLAKDAVNSVQSASRNRPGIFR